MRKPEKINLALQIPKRNSARHYIRQVGLCFNEDPAFLEQYASEQIDAHKDNLEALIDCFVSLYSKYAKDDNMHADIHIGSPLLREMRPAPSSLLPMGIKPGKIDQGETIAGDTPSRVRRE